MQFPESWLRSFCHPALDSAALSHTLTMAGLEVEEQRPAAPPFTGVVIAEIVSAEPHPNADRLRVCRVDAGVHSADGPLQIVCGAPNARAGIRVPLALEGAVLPPGADGASFHIRRGLLRGVESQGMLCSARELHLSEDHGGLMELPADAPVGASLRDWLQLDDQLLTLKLTPNLAHHLSVRGIGRELAALTGAPFHDVAVPAVPDTLPERFPVTIEAPDLCGRFSGRVVRNINARAATPAWMVQRLARCGQRSVSALVDISNYVMFELGQPTHIFDLSKVQDGLTVRWAREGESLELLNGQTVALTPDVGVIADATGVESLAGIMGGNACAVSDDTTAIYMEAAFWWPRAIAGRARRYHFSTDAGHRFERGVDPELTVRALERITALVLEICGTSETACGPIDDQRLGSSARPPVRVRVARVARVLGMDVPAAQCADIFERLGCTVVPESTDLGASAAPTASEEVVFQVQPPTWRFDLQIEEDFIEEVARLVGYDALPDTPPKAPIVARIRPERQRSVHSIKHRLAGLDYQEGIHFSFVEPQWELDFANNADPIKVLNPIAAPLSVMRSTLIGSLIDAARSNLARKAQRVRLFEVGRVFRRDASVPDSDTTVAGIDQPLHIAGLALGTVDSLQWGVATRAVDFFDVKGDVEALCAPRVLTFKAAEHPALHPGRSAQVICGGRTIGWVGEIHPKWRQSYGFQGSVGLFELDLAAVMERDVPVHRPVSKIQASQRDLALWVPDGVSHDALVGCLGDDPLGLIQTVRLFDVFRPKSVSDAESSDRSMAVRLELLDPGQTLTDERIEAAVQQALARVQALDVRLRT